MPLLRVVGEEFASQALVLAKSLGVAHKLHAVGLAAIPDHTLSAWVQDFRTIMGLSGPGTDPVNVSAPPAPQPAAQEEAREPKAAEDQPALDHSSTKDEVVEAVEPEATPLQPILEALLKSEGAEGTAASTEGSALPERDAEPQEVVRALQAKLDQIDPTGKELIAQALEPLSEGLNKRVCVCVCVCVCVWCLLAPDMSHVWRSI